MQIANNIHAFIWESMSANNCNTYLIDGPTRILIDPGHRHLFDHVHEGLMELNLTLEDIGLIICTHAHPDHMEAVQLFNKIPTLITLHPKEWSFLKTMDKHILASIGLDIELIEPDFFLTEGDVSVNRLNMEVIHTPGHSSDSICLYCEEDGVLFAGDTPVISAPAHGSFEQGFVQAMEKLFRRDIRSIYFGHGLPKHDDCNKHIRNSLVNVRKSIEQGRNGTGQTLVRSKYAEKDKF